MSILNLFLLHEVRNIRNDLKMKSNSTIIDSRYEVNEDNFDTGKEYDVPEEYLEQFRKNLM